MTQVLKATVKQDDTKPNARAHLRALFAKADVEIPEKAVFADYHKVTIKTHLTDFKNAKYAGKLGTMNIVKLANGNYKRLADTPTAKKA